MRTFLADFDHQQRFGRNPLIIQLGLIHGSLGCYPLTLVYCLPLLFARRTNRAPGGSLPKIVLGYFVLCLFSFGLAAYLTVYSFPSIFTALMGQYHEFRSVVEAKDGTSRGCRHDIKLKDFGYGIHEMVCTDPSLWERIRVGDVVRVDSSKSALGIRVSDMEIER